MKRIFYGKKTADANQVAGMVERVMATDSHPGHDRIGNQPEHLNGLTVTIRIRNRLQ